MLIVVRHLHTNICMVWIIVNRTFCHRAPVFRCVTDGEDGPSVELPGHIASFMPSSDRESRHLRAVCVVHSIDGDLVIGPTDQEHLWDGLQLSCLLGTRLRIHASAEVLVLGQGRQSLTQRTARGTIVPAHATGPKVNPAAASTHLRGADVRSFRSLTSSSLHPLRCPARSAARQRRPVT